MTVAKPPRRRAASAAAKPSLEIPAEVTKGELERLTGYSAKQLTRFVQATDIPHRRLSGDLLFPWPAVRAWLHGYLEEKGKRAADPVDKTNARQRKEIAEAELAEIELAEARGEIMLVSDGEQWLADAFSRVRAKLGNLNSRFVDVTFGAATALEAEQRGQAIIDEVFAELRRTDDLPDDAVADEPGVEEVAE